MKIFPFTVTFKVSDSIYNDEEIVEMMRNMAEAIQNHIDHSEKGITPEASEGFVEHFSVYSADIGEKIFVNMG